ncbi:MAG: DUF3987 domain-containing protein [Polyangiaceae bacterium]
MRDPIERVNPKTGEVETVDEGVDDKRLLVVEPEFASPLKVLAREGNTLSPLIRCAWDTGKLRSLTKNSPAVATNAHISIIGHVTRAELHRCFSETEALNGFGNRFLWFCARRSKFLPEGGRRDPPGLVEITARIGAAVVAATARSGEVERDEAARQLWIESYPELSAERPGLLGGMTARAEAQVLRLSLLYALLDGAERIGVEHLRAALEVWRYCFDSAAYIFGQATGNPLADRIGDLLDGAGAAGLTRTEIRKGLDNHIKAKEILAALVELHRAGIARMDLEPTTRRPRERWYRVGNLGNLGNKSSPQGFAGDADMGTYSANAEGDPEAGNKFPAADGLESRDAEQSSPSSPSSPPAIEDWRAEL